jgi:hypothetical protein
MTRKKNNRRRRGVNTSIITIVQTLYGVARTAGAMKDGGVKNIRPALWKNDMQYAADQFSKRILREVVEKAIKPYEDALRRYAIYHLPGCSTWQGGKQCDCGMEYLQEVLRANLTLYK